MKKQNNKYQFRLHFSVLFFVFALFSLPLGKGWGWASAQSLLDTASLLASPIYNNLQEALQNPDKVYRLDLSKKKLKVFPVEILKFKNLQELNISKNKLDSLPEQIGTLTNLQVLNVSGNKLQYLPDSIGELKNLKKLVGSRNNLLALPKRIGDLENIEIIDLWENDLSSFPEELSKLKKLRWMDLRVIMIDDNQQERIRQLLPKAKIFFSPSCHCVTG
ncbi:MAG: leucine-rich repeat domain-containing protein [Bacteroidetes bacterium]|nr:leucine-rich repeat domain-containing protein [Bacteroidota bacterium]